jgi:hypothetical protein
MNLYALFRLLWCPARIATPAGIVLGGVFVSAPLLFVNIDSADRAGALAALLFPALAGFVVGQAVGELELCSFSWTLPGLHRRLLSPVGLTGFVGALAAVGLHITLVGSYGPGIFGLAALGFTLGLATATPYLLADPSARFAASSLFPPVAIVLAAILIDRIASLCQAQPIPCFVVSVAGAALYLWRRFDPAVAKTRLTPADAASVPSSYGEISASAGKTGPSWDRPYLGTSTANWIRAGEHENFGRKRLGLLRMIMLHALLGPVFIGALVWSLGMVQKNTMLESDQILYWLLFVPPGHATPLVSAAVALDEPSLPAIFYWLGALWFGFLVAASTFEPVVTLSISLRRGWLYPLSRTHLARVAYRGGLMQSAAALGSMAILYCLLAMLSLSIAGQRFSYDFVPSFVLALALAFVLMPAAHWTGLKHLPQLTFVQKSFRVALWKLPGAWLGAPPLFALAVGILLVLWRLWIPATLFQGLIILAGLAVISQWIYRRAVKAHFAHGDLV